MTLYIKVVSAVLTHDTDLFNNMDPYCIIKIGSEKKQTRTKKEGGKKPTWDETLTFKSLNAQSIQVTVMDKDHFKDDVVGSGTLSLSKFKNTTDEFKQYVGLTYKGKPAGKIFLCIKYGSQGSSWGNHVQSNWSSQNNNNSGWGNQNNNNNNNSNWRNQNNNNNNSGWGNQNNNNSDWGSNNNGWGNQQNNNHNNNGWGNQTNNNTNNSSKPPQQYQSNFMNAMESMANNSSGWGNQNQSQNQNNQNNNNGW